MLPEGFVTFIPSSDKARERLGIITEDVRAMHKAGYAALVTVQRVGAKKNDQMQTVRKGHPASEKASADATRQAALS